MNPLAILTSLEGAVFEVVVWLLLVPKTLFQVLRHPAWVVDYTAAQFQKAEADRWDDYLSPVVFWLLLAVGPYLWGTSVVPHRYGAPGQLSGDVLSHLPLPTRYLLLALLLVAAPATLAVLFARIRGHGLARRLLRQHFAAQCYLQTPTLLCVMPIVVSVLFAPRAEMLAHFSGTVSLIGLAGLSLLWLLAAERDRTDGRGGERSVSPWAVHSWEASSSAPSSLPRRTWLTRHTCSCRRLEQTGRRRWWNPSPPTFRVGGDISTSPFKHSAARPRCPGPRTKPHRWVVRQD